MTALADASLPSALPAPRPQWLLVAMIVLTVGYAALFCFALLAALVSPMVFDSGESTKTWSAFFAFLFFPVLVLLALALAWSGFGFRRYLLIPIGVALPIAYCLVFWFAFS